jgi:hypothetical protein
MILGFRLCTTPSFGARAVDASTHMSDTPTMARLASVPMISRTFILPPHDDEYDGKGDCAKQHPTQYGADSFGNGDGVVVFH